MFGFAIAVLLVAIFTLLPGWIAERRGRSARLWYWLGAIFGPFAALAIILLPPVREATGRPPEGPAGSARRRGLWRRTPERASGEPRGPDLVLTPAA